jgi:hypothetical protein
MNVKRWKEGYLLEIAQQLLGEVCSQWTLGEVSKSGRGITQSYASLPKCTQKEVYMQVNLWVWKPWMISRCTILLGKFGMHDYAVMWKNITWLRSKLGRFHSGFCVARKIKWAWKQCFNGRHKIHPMHHKASEKQYVRHLWSRGERKGKVEV